MAKTISKMKNAVVLGKEIEYWCHVFYMKRFIAIQFGNVKKKKKNLYFLLRYKGMDNWTPGTSVTTPV